MKAYLIARVSTEEQRDALPGQVYKLTDYAKRHNFNYEIIQFQESAYSGNRDEFRTIIDKIISLDEEVAVVFDKVDRLTRDSTDPLLRLLQKLARSGEIELHFVSESLVFNQNSPSSIKMQLGISTIMAENYSSMISDNVKRRLDQKLRDGEWIGQAPYGYRNVTRPNGSKTVVIDELRADVVKSIFKWYATGVTSYRLIKKRLQKELGVNLATSKIGYILKNPFYIGLMLVKGKLYPHQYERFISDQMKEKIEAVWLSYSIKPVQSVGLPYRYRGLFRCGECDCTVTFEKKKGVYIYGHCTQKKGKHGADYVPESSFTNQLKKMFDDIAMPEDAYNDIAAAYEKSYNQERKMKAENLHQIEAEIKRTQNRIERVYDDYLDDKIPEELYRRKFDEFSEIKQKLEIRREKFELIEKDTFSTISHLLKLSKDAPKLFKKADLEQTRKLVNMVGSNLQLVGKELRWELKKPYDCMAICNKSGDWLRLLGSNQRHPR
jgi:site-specific DNA recombinase